MLPWGKAGMFPVTDQGGPGPRYKGEARQAKRGQIEGRNKMSTFRQRQISIPGKFYCTGFLFIFLA